MGNHSAVIFQYLLLAQLHATEYQKVYIDGSSQTYLNGPYSWCYYDPHLNGSIYYKEENTQYLHPIINTNANYDNHIEYHINNDMTGAHPNAYCEIPNKTSSYKFNIDDCYNNWHTRNGAKGEWIHDSNMLLFNIDSICIGGSINQYLNGRYTWTHFNRTMNSSVYYCDPVGNITCTGLYLFGYIKNGTNQTPHFYWMLGTDHTQWLGWSSCNIGKDLHPNYVFSIDDCIQWQTYNGSSFVIDEHMTAKRCYFIANTTSHNDTNISTTIPPYYDNREAFSSQIMIILIVLGVLLLGIVIFCGYKQYKKHKQKDKYKPVKFQNSNSPIDNSELQPLDQTPKSRTPIEKPLVVIIGIGDYETDKNKQIDNDITGDFTSFPVEKDVENLRQLFDLLGYPSDTILPTEDDKHYNNKYWSQQELITFLENAGKKLVSVDECGELKYDALICAVSSHGIENHIITSDYKAVHKTAVHRIFSVKYRKSREIPRIFIFDCCEGPQSRIKTDGNKTETETNEIGKYFGVQNLGENKMWINDEKNPDFMLVEIHAANTGFEAKCSAQNGSYLLYEFTKKVRENFKNEKQEILGRTFEKIQNELHQKGKQQTINVFNNDTRNLILKKRNIFPESV